MISAAILSEGMLNCSLVGKPVYQQTQLQSMMGVSMPSSCRLGYRPHPDRLARAPDHFAVICRLAHLQAVLRTGICPACDPGILANIRSRGLVWRPLCTQHDYCEARKKSPSWVREL